jgi:hypothetical protein
MKDDLQQFRDALEIDPDQLDVEWLEQAVTFERVAAAEARAREQEAMAKFKRDQVRADLDKEIRSDPEEFIDGKATEGAIQNAILKQPEYIKAQKRRLAAKRRADELTALCRAFYQRKEALENLCRLMGMDYFTGPLEPRDLSTQAAKRKRTEQHEKTARKRTVVKKRKKTKEN